MTAIAIMAILMSIMIYGIGQYRRQAFQTGTKATLENVKSALNAYYGQYRQYPPDGHDFVVKRSYKGQDRAIKGSQCLIYFLGTELPQEVEIGQDTRVVLGKPFMEITADMLSGDGELEDRLDDPATELVDKYNNALHYDNVQPDKDGTVRVSEQSDKHIMSGDMLQAPDPRRAGGGGGKSGGGGSPGGGVVARNKGAYDMWSHGFNIPDVNDDITNWK